VNQRWVGSLLLVALLAVTSGALQRLHMACDDDDAVAASPISTPTAAHQNQLKSPEKQAPAHPPHDEDNCLTCATLHAAMLSIPMTIPDLQPQERLGIAEVWFISAEGRQAAAQLNCRGPPIA